MKKRICVLLCAVLILSLSGCGGKVDSVKVKDVASDVYTQQDIDDAIAVILDDFKRNWNGCILTEIYYAGDEYSKDYQNWAYRHDADEVLVLLSSFDVDHTGGDGSLNPDSTYGYWNWILVRTKGGEWKHVDHGY